MRISVVSLLVLAVFVAYASQVLALFYDSGATSYDAGWFAYVLSRFDFPPDNPLYLQQRDIPSFFAFHFAPLMPLWGALSQTLGLSPALAFAAYQGFFHALLVLVGIHLVPRAADTSGEFALRVLTGLALAFSPVALSTITYVHHELAMPILFMAAAVAWSRNRKVLAAIAFALCLAVRTDAGFHAAVFLFALLAAEFLLRRRILWGLACAGAIAFLYSVAAFAIVHFEFPQFDNFRFSYAGNHFDHVSMEFVLRRLATLFDKRPELYVLFLTTLAVGAARRSLHTVFGALAILPWLTLHMIALRDIPGELYTYYAFPFLLLAAWPFLVPLLLARSVAEQPPVDPRARTIWLAGSAVALLAYLASPFSSPELHRARLAALRGFVPSVSFGTIGRVDRFSVGLERLEQARSVPVYVDEAVVSVVPDTGRDFIFRPGASVVPAGDAPFLVAYYARYEHASEIERLYLPAASDCFALGDTPVRILARNVAEATILGLEPGMARGRCPEVRP